MLTIKFFPSWKSLTDCWNRKASILSLSDDLIIQYNLWHRPESYKILEQPLKLHCKVHVMSDVTWSTEITRFLCALVHCFGSRPLGGPDTVLPTETGSTEKNERLGVQLLHRIASHIPSWVRKSVITEDGRRRHRHPTAGTCHGLNVRLQKNRVKL